MTSCRWHLLGVSTTMAADSDTSARCLALYVSAGMARIVWHAGDVGRRWLELMLFLDRTPTCCLQERGAV